MAEQSILDEAKQVIADRRTRVDDPNGNFWRIAQIWAVVFGHEVTPKQVTLAMIGVKLARECYKPWRDNLVDLAGYADCADQIERSDDAEFDPLESVYEFRAKCQAERDRNEHTHPQTWGQHVSATPGSYGPGRPDIASGPCNAVARDGDGTPRSEYADPWDPFDPRPSRSR